MAAPHKNDIDTVAAEAIAWLKSIVDGSRSPHATYKFVYTGTRSAPGRVVWPRKVHRFRSAEDVDNPSFFSEKFGDSDRVLEDLGSLLFSDTETGTQRALFVEQVFSKTCLFTGQKDRLTFVEMLVSVLARKFVPKDLKFVAKAVSAQRASGAVLLRRVLTYTDNASIWPVNDVVKLYDRFLSGSGNIVAAMCGSWGSPVLAKQRVSSIARLIVYDVIPDYERAISRIEPGDDVTVHISGTEKGTAGEGQVCDLVIWNPPYWVVEMYDATKTDDLFINQQVEQSTAAPDQTFAEWLEAYIKPSAETARDLLAPSGRLCIVVPSSIRLHVSFRDKFNTKGLTQRGAGFDIPDFATKIAETVSMVNELSLDLTEAQRTFQQGTTGNKEMLLVFSKK